MSGTTLDALLASEAGNRRMAVLVEEGPSPATPAIPAGVLVVLCARDHGHAVVTSGPDDVRGIDPVVEIIPVWPGTATPRTA